MKHFWEVHHKKKIHGLRNCLIELDFIIPKMIFPQLYKRHSWLINIENHCVVKDLLNFPRTISAFTTNLVLSSILCNNIHQKDIMRIKSSDEEKFRRHLHKTKRHTEIIESSIGTLRILVPTNYEDFIVSLCVAE